ncbi:MAG: hypothetical protein ABI442_02645 [Gemmatimonadaceae bacterium]
MRLRLRSVAMSLAVVIAVGYGVVRYAHRPSKGHPSAFTPADTSLQHDWLYFYPSRATDGSKPRALVFFFGNDVAFWEPHQDLAWRFAGEGYSVVGLDARKFLGTLPSNEPQRDSAFGPAIASVIARTRHAMSADSIPVVLAGHSFGAELAFWTALHAPPPGLIGILSLNTRSTGHLFITPGDLLNHEASGAWSFSVIDAARRIDPHVKIALVRSEHDPFKQHDPDFEAAGGPRLRRFLIPLAAHTMKTILVAGPLVSRALRYLTDTTTAP